MPMFPIWINDGKNPPPDNPIYYELAANGLFLVKTNEFWRAVVPVDKISILEKETPSIDIFLPQIPAAVVEEMTRIFYWAYLTFQSEAAVILWFKDGSYLITIPEQKVSSGRVEYQIADYRDGRKLIGTFHSHGSTSAFHSPVDRCDENSIDGIHGTFGNFSRFFRSSDFSVSIEAAVNGARFSLKPEMILGGIEKSVEEIPEAKIVDPVEAKRKRFVLPPKREWSYSLDPDRNVDKYTLESSRSGKAPILPKDFEVPKDWQRLIVPHRAGWIEYGVKFVEKACLGRPSVDRYRPREKDHTGSCEGSE